MHPLGAGESYHNPFRSQDAANFNVDFGVERESLEVDTRAGVEDQVLDLVEATGPTEEGQQRVEEDVAMVCLEPPTSQPG